ncbi:MAG: glycosyltransferase family 1 protein [Acidobacteriota bacterium]
MSSRPNPEADSASTDPASAGRRWRKMLRPIHPNRIRARLHHLANILGWGRAKHWLKGLRPHDLAATWRFRRAVREAITRRRGEERLTVAVDIAPFWEPLTGIGWYLYRLLHALADRDDLRLRLYGPGMVDGGWLPEPSVELPSGPAIEVVHYRVPDRFVLPRDWFADRWRRFEDRLVAADENDVLFAPNFFLPDRFRRCDGSLVATIHDLTVLVAPETMRASTRRDLEARLRGTVESAVMILTDSEAVRGEIADRGLKSADRVRAVPLAPGATVGVDGRVPDDAPARYVLFVGTVEPRKNLAVLVEGFERFRDGLTDEQRAAGQDIRLVLCGGRGWEREATEERLAAAEEAGWLRRYGYLPETELVGLYTSAEWLALPSIYEGFGLPAVEGMAAGVPLLLADIPVLREVGGDAALYASPDAPEAWAALLRRVLVDEPTVRDEVATASRARASTFTWDRTADETVAVWRDAAEIGR